MEQTGVVFIRGRKTILRPLNKETDLESCLRWINDPKVTHFLTAFLPITKTEESKWFDKTRESYPESVTLAIENLDGRLIGTMGLHNINWRSRVGTTGAVIGEKDCWGQGYGTDAKMHLLNWAFNTANLRKICSAVLAFNNRSISYSLHCGYKIEGRRRKQFYCDGRYVDEVLLGVFKPEWLPIWQRYNKTGEIR